MLSLSLSLLFSFFAVFPLFFASLLPDFSSFYLLVFPISQSFSPSYTPCLTAVVPAVEVGQAGSHSALGIQQNVWNTQAHKPRKHALLKVAELAEGIVLNHRRKLE